jgi:5-carboxymethyl-2-hydroxymuconate isomerase
MRTIVFVFLKKRELIQLTTIYMPHLIIEHSANISKSSIINLQKNIQNIMSVVEGNFDPDQCKARALSFDDYLVGLTDQTTSSFIHITLKVLTGRTVQIRKNLAEKILEFSREFLFDLKLLGKRHEISVDIVEMERETYQKFVVEL